MDVIRNILSYIKHLVTTPVLFSYRLFINTAVSGFIMMFVCFFVYTVLQLLGILPPDIVVVDPQILPVKHFWQLCFLCLQIGIMEEVIFRYLIFDKMFRQWFRIPVFTATILASVLFGLAHFNNITVFHGFWEVLPQVIGASFIGIWLTYIYRKFGLAMAIFTHGLYDFYCFVSYSAWSWWIVITIGIFYLMLLWVGKLPTYEGKTDKKTVIR
jgi:membrane protease YdiL (CAAX protease family)